MPFLFKNIINIFFILKIFYNKNKVNVCIIQKAKIWNI